jgi:phage FluMu gp28-like protein
MNEIWKEFDNYLISNKGIVKNPKTNKTTKGYKNKDGYLMVKLNNKKCYLVHRLVAMLFLENKNNLPFVNHKDEIKTNNCVENLEWCTNQYNVNYGTANERRSKTLGFKVAQLENGKLITIYDSCMEAARQLGKKMGCHINDVCNGKRKSAYGYQWKYIEH